MIIYAQDKVEEKYYRLDVTQKWAVSHDNGCLISCGLVVEEDFSRNVLKSLIGRGHAREVPKQEWQHSGCQSSCTLRGGKECRW